MASIKMKDAEKARNSIAKKNSKEIKEIYRKAYESVKDELNKVAHSDGKSRAYKEQALRDLKKALRDAQTQAGIEVQNKIKKGILDVSQAVCDDAAKWAEKVFKVNLVSSYLNVPKSVVEKLTYGQVYESGWSLSKRIWSENKKTQEAIYKIIAEMTAQGKSAEEIAKAIERFVNPSAKKKVKTGVGKNRVDYNAMRLARTLVQHAYQQAMVEVTKNNPWCMYYVWHANGGHSCPMCRDRDGRQYDKNDLPLDHPNGMCTVVPEIDMDKCIDDIAKWYEADWGTYPEIDKFAEELCGEDAVNILKK